MTAAIECIELTRAYGRRAIALDNLTLAISAGESFGLLGENGAGKSTLVRLIMGFILPSSGQIRVLGEDQVNRAHTRIGYVHERPIFETGFTGRQFLRYMAELCSLIGGDRDKRINEVLALVALEAQAADQKIGQYSKGMLQRLAIAQALLTNPDLIIFDEPTSGLDPRSQWEVRQMISGLRNQGKTILLCSHYLAEVEAICGTVGILRKGKMILHGRVSDLLHGRDLVEITLKQEVSAAEIVRRVDLQKIAVETEANILRIPARSQAEVLARLVQRNIQIHSLHPLNQTLEEIYVQTIRQADEQKMIAKENEHAH